VEEKFQWKSRSCEQVCHFFVRSKISSGNEGYREHNGKNKQIASEAVPLEMKVIFQPNLYLSSQRVQ